MILNSENITAMSSPKIPSSNHEESTTNDDEQRLELEPSSSSEAPQFINSSNDTEESVAVPKTSKLGRCRKNDQCVQQALRSLNRLSTSEEKFTVICAKYADIFDENRKLQATLKEQQKQISSLTKEKDQTRSELMKAIFTKDKLENLCRELQRQNREIREESLQKIKEEEQKRKEVSSKFQTTLNEITELMKQDSDKTMKLRDDNVDMTSKLNSIYEQYEIREQQIERMTKQMALESQLYEAKIAKLEMETAAEKEVLLREKQQLLLTLTEYQAKFQEYQNIEVTLRNQVALYNNKYEEFEKSLTRSNEVFGGFKSEMENMSNKIVKLESETAAWKLRWEKTQKALIEMASEKQKSDQEIVLAAKQMATLHKLCRTLQSERTQFLAKLKESASQNEPVKNNSNIAADVNLLPTKIIDENLQISQNYAEEKSTNSKSKAQTKSLPATEKSLGVPKTKSKIDKKPAAVSTSGNCSQNTSAKMTELKTAVAQLDINECKKNHESVVNNVSSEEPSSLSVNEISLANNERIVDSPEDLYQQIEPSMPSSIDSVPVNNIQSELQNDACNLSNDSTHVAAEETGEKISPQVEFLQNKSILSTSEVKIGATLPEISSEPVEFTSKNPVQNCKKKAISKKKNKK